MSLISKEISNFGTQAFQNDNFRVVSREDLHGKRSIFLFYPADFIFAYPTELEDLENNCTAFQKTSCEIYSVSCDTHFIHKAWHDHSEKISKIACPMLVGPTQALARDFKVLIPEADLVERGTFIVDPDLRIVAYEVNVGNVDRNAEELLRKVQACQFIRKRGDEVCPIEQTPGAETLKPSLDLVGAL